MGAGAESHVTGSQTAKKSSLSSPSVSQAVVALSASPTAYSALPGKVLAEAPTLAGSSVGLAVLVQTRNNARVAVVGSVELFGDDFFQASVTSEGRYAPNLICSCTCSAPF